MPSTYLTRIIRFAAAHRYHRPEWSEARNREIFGACANPHGHGHDYRLEVTVAGEPHPETGFSVDLPALDAVLEEEIVRRFDHQHINHAEPAFGEGGLIPTTENLVVFCWEQVAPRMPAGSRLFRMRLWEREDLCVEYYGEREPRDGVRMV